MYNAVLAAHDEDDFGSFFSKVGAGLKSIGKKVGSAAATASAQVAQRELEKRTGIKKPAARGTPPKPAPPMLYVDKGPLYKAPSAGLSTPVKIGIAAAIGGVVLLLVMRRPSPKAA